tara:strand:- start:384 stop:572 length:189 start_codon:yes stop_codon:yes gene_type:complete
MKLLFINIKNLFPYIFLITLYFLFVNIEASKDYNNSVLIKQETSVIDEDVQRISIPVIPYKE